MIFFVLILLLLAFNKAEFSKPNEFNKNYISPDGTLAIKGIFVALILLSHGKGYIDVTGQYDTAYVTMQNHLNQMVVAMFMFYSGFGMMESIKKKQFGYIKSIPQKRFPHLLLVYDIAVIFYAVLQIALGGKLNGKQIFEALVAWNGIGNSSWYIFVILALYVITFISFLPKAFTQNKIIEFISIIALTVGSILLIYLLMKSGKERFWFNTLILFALGFWYSYFKDIIEKVLMKNDIIYFLGLAGIVVIYILAYLHRWDRLLAYEIWAIAFVLLTVMLTMKISLQNQVLKFLGEHIFSIYILQRIPMILLDHIGVSDRHKYIFLITSYAITFFMAVAYDKATGKLTQLIWKPKKDK